MNLVYSFFETGLYDNSLLNGKSILPHLENAENDLYERVRNKT